MAERQYDVTVIGGGPGGYVAAIRAAQLGFKVGLVERDKLGGVCLNWGCIPSKALLKSAELYSKFKESEEYGITAKELSYDFGKIIHRSRDIADRQSKGVEYLMKKNKVEVVFGEAKFTGKNLLEVSKDGRVVDTIKTKNTILATGGRPRSIPGVAIDGKKIISSSEAMTLPKQPKSMLVIGAGAIGVEFAYFYNAFGTKITIIEMLPTVLPVEDREISKILDSSLEHYYTEIYVMSSDGTGAAQLTVDTHYVDDPAWSPNATRIAFAAGNGISVMNADGRDLVELSKDGFSPAWSPDGKHIAFVRWQVGGSDIWVMNEDATGLARLTSFPSTQPHWSPDGTRISFTGSDGMFLMNADGSGLVRLGKASDRAGGWSPDGQMIAFTRRQLGNVDIYLMNLDGSGLVRLTANADEEYPPLFWPVAGRAARR